MNDGASHARIEVVAAVIEADGRFLLTRRPMGVHLEGLWEFPGGKVEPGESHADALRREIREELGADVEVRDLVLTTTHAYPERSITLHFHWCVFLTAPHPMLGQEMRWVPRAELPDLGLPPADAELIDLLTSPDGH